MYYEDLVVITLIAFTFVGLYGLGSLINRLKSNKYLKAIWKQLKKLGKSAEYKSLGSSGFIITIDNVNKQTRRIEISIILEKREFPLNWIIDKLRRKSDTLSLSIHYDKQIYNVEINVVKPGNYYGNTYIKFHGKGSEINGIYLYPVGINIDKKVNQLLKIIGEYEDIHMLTLKPDKRSILVIANTRITANLGTLIQKLIDI